MKLASAITALVCVALVTWVIVTYGVSGSYILRSTGSIKTMGVGVYSDSGCTQALTTVDWGVADPGSTKQVTIYIRNESNVPVTLSLTTSNWNPANAANYMSLSWNYNGQAIGVNQVIQVTLSLTISPNIQGITTYSFDIVISTVG